MLEAYRAHVAERAEAGIVPKPLDAEQTAGLIELLKAPPAGEEDFLMSCSLREFQQEWIKRPMLRPVFCLQLSTEKPVHP